MQSHALRQSLAAAAAFAVLALAAGCTTTNVDAPPLAGPSTFANNVGIEAAPDVLPFDPTIGSTITITTRDEMGQPQAVNLAAEVRVNNVVQDFGTLSAKSVTTSASTGIARLTYFPPNAATKSYQTVTIAVYPIGTSYGTQHSRSVDIRLIPPGTIGPSNPTLVAAFTFSPASPTAYTLTSFSAAGTTNQGSACGTACSYSWDFGDGTSGTGLAPTHEFRTAGSKTVTLTVTDTIGAAASISQVLTVGASTPPTASFTFSPTAPGVGQDVFFNASASRPATGRSIVGYNWNFGDGATGSGVTTTHRYSALGSYSVTVQVTDDATAVGQSSSNVTVASGLPTVTLTVVKATGRKVTVTVTATPVAGSTISNYAFKWGDLSDDDSGVAVSQTHTYAADGTYAITVKVTDSVGRQTSVTQQVVIP